MAKTYGRKSPAGPNFRGELRSCCWASVHRKAPRFSVVNGLRFISLSNRRGRGCVSRRASIISFLSKESVDNPRRN